MVVKVYDCKENKYSLIENVAKIKPYKTFYSDNYFMIKFNGEDDWREYSKDEYDIDEILEDK